MSPQVQVLFGYIKNKRHPYGCLLFLVEVHRTELAFYETVH
nr:MAG TPA: hypothetical protein [Caudoviricetes sp.]